MGYPFLHPDVKNHIGTHVFSNGNLTITTTLSSTAVRGTFGKSAGLSYFEISIGSGGTNNQIGLAPAKHPANQPISTGSIGYAYQQDGQKTASGIASSYGDSFGAGDVVGCYFDGDKVWFSKNGVIQNSGDPLSGINPAFTGLAGIFLPMGSQGQGNMTFNFGATPWSYAPVTGYENGWHDDSLSYMYAYRGYEGGNPNNCGGCNTYGAGTWAGNNNFYIGALSGTNGPWDGYFLFDRLYLPSIYTLFSAKIWFSSSYNNSETDVHVLLSAEKTTSPSEPSSCATLNAAIANRTLATTAWNPGPWTTLTGARFDTPDIVDIIKEILALPAWSSGGPIMILYEDDGSTAFHERRPNPDDRTEYNYIEIEYKSGAPVVHEPVIIDSVGVSDEADGKIDAKGESVDGIGIGDSADAGPYFYQDEDGVGMGDAADAEIQNVQTEDGSGISDDADAFDLSPDGEDEIGISDAAEAFDLSPDADDQIGISDAADATATKDLSFGDSFAPQYYTEPLATVSEFPIVTISGRLPLPSGVVNGAATVIGRLPLPSGAISGIQPITSIVDGRLPIPVGGAITVVIPITVSAQGYLPLPKGAVTIENLVIAKVDGKLPIPSGNIAIGLDVHVHVDGGIPLPAGKITGRIPRQFGTQKYSRCEIG